MVQVRRRCFWAVFSLPALFLVAGILVVPKEAGSDASGCTRFDNAAPDWEGCIQAQGQACYYCEYSYAGGWSECYEDGAGGTGFCTDHQY